MLLSPALLQIKELISRNLDAVDISRRLHMDRDVVRLAMQLLATLS